MDGWKHINATALILAGFALAGTGVVATIHSLTEERIIESERQALLKSLYELIPPSRFDNQPDQDFIEINNPLLGPYPSRIYRIRKGGEPVASVLQIVAPNGYSGDIQLLLAVELDGTVAGSRVTSHLETPGLGDKIELRKSDWITHFTGTSLSEPKPEQWGVKKDGGVFDQFTGATITPRAVVQAIKNALTFYQRERSTLFEAPTP